MAWFDFLTRFLKKLERGFPWQAPDGPGTRDNVENWWELYRRKMKKGFEDFGVAICGLGLRTAKGQLCPKGCASRDGSRWCGGTGHPNSTESSSWESEGRWRMRKVQTTSPFLFYHTFLSCCCFFFFFINNNNNDNNNNNNIMMRCILDMSDAGHARFLS